LRHAPTIQRHATAGFFRVKKQIPQILETTGLR